MIKNCLVNFLECLITALRGGITLTGEKFMYIVKDDNPDVNFSTSFVAEDSEGNEVPEDSLVVAVVSDNPAAVAVTSTDGKSGSISFGSPGTANLNCSVSTSDGTLLGSFGAQFTVTVGDPKAISGGSLVFDGLTESV